MSAPVAAAVITSSRHQGGAVVRLVIEAVDPAPERYELYRDEYPTAATTLLKEFTPGIVYDTPPDVDTYSYRTRAINTHIEEDDTDPMNPIFTTVDDPSPYSSAVTVKVYDVQDSGSSTAAKRINRAL